VVSVDERGVTIKNGLRPGAESLIPFAKIRSARLMDLRVGTGRYRLVGISPGRPFHFFHWDRDRAAKRVAISLDTGRWIKRAITPDDAAAVFGIIEDHIG
jgi:hypothetical protein